METRIHTDYAAHDVEYRRRKERGDSCGWKTPEGLQVEIDCMSKLLRREDIPKSGRFLEVGCGSGEITLWMARQGFQAHGVDIAATAIDWGREKAQFQEIPADFRVGDVRDLAEYPDEFFDFVLDGHCLHCIIGDDRRLFLSSVFRILKPGGYFRVNTMSGEFRTVSLMKDFDPATCCLMRGEGGARYAERYIGLPEDILKEITQAGFLIMHWEVADNENEEEQPDLLVDAFKPDSGSS